MTEMAGPEHDPRIDLEGVPEEEQVSQADAAERADEDPEEQQNKKDPVADADETDR